VLVKLVNGEPHGMFILTAEPKELTIVLIMGPIRLDQLGELSGIAGLGSLGDVAGNNGARDHEKAKAKTETKTKSKTEDKKGGDQ
jgi:hypothetical protein